LSAVRGGTQSLHTNAYDEALPIPTVEAATLALRTQLVVAYESGVAGPADPLAGSYYVERLTTELEERALALLSRVEEIGGAVRAIEEGFFQEEIGKSAYEHQLRVERGETVVVGVNAFTDDEPPLAIPAPDFRALERDQLARLARTRAARDGGAVAVALAALGAATLGADAAASARLMPLIIDAARVRATLGEISDTLAAAWGVYRPSR
ncbi:MAG: methylmalonyl-CoA mutase family protein, partial [Gemmatimonadales bacterium]